MKSRASSLFACFLALAFFALPNARAQLILYGATGGVKPGSLYTIDPTTGASTLVGPLVDNTAHDYALTGLAFDSATGVLYGATSFQSPTAAGELVTVNTSTGLVTPVGLFGINLGDITFDSVNNTLYGTASSNADLYSINLTTGVATHIGSAMTNGSALGVGVAASPSGTIYGSPNGSNGDLIIYDPSNGSSSVVHTLTGAPYGTNGSIGALAFSPSGILYGADINRADNARGASLVTIDLTSGLVTDIGLTVNNLDAIAFSAVPEPSTWLASALATGYVAFLFFRRRGIFGSSKIAVRS